MALTLEEVRENLALWRKAEQAIATAQSYTMGNRTLTRANLNEVIKRINYWEEKETEIEMRAQGKRMRRTKQFIPRDW